MKLHEALRIDLDKVHRSLLTVIEEDPELPRPSVIYDSIAELIRSGGKRLRPILVIVGSRFGSEQRQDQVLRAAALLEYMHMASLVHDDIIDNAELRRNAKTIHVKTDIRTAVHIANYMMARAVEWSAAGDGDPKHSAEMASLVTGLCMGEYQQLQTRFDFDMTLELYLEKTRRKTALLMGSCLQAGAEAAQAEDSTCRDLYAFGEALGMAFQIADDLLDFTPSAAAIGKPVGADLRNGQVTLPVLYALEAPTLAPLIRQLSADSSPEAFDELIHLLAASPAIQRSRELALSYTSKAGQIAERYKEHPAYKDLRLLLDYFSH